MKTRRAFLAAAGAAATAAGAALAGCANVFGGAEEEAPKTPAQQEPNKYKDLLVDMGKWSYDEDHNVWYQLALATCLTPEAPTYEAASIFVPGPYLTGTKSGSTYTCEVVPDAQVGSWTATTAPVIFPLNAPGFTAQAPATTYSYQGLAEFMEAGCVYVFAGMRGRSSGYEKIAGQDSYFEGGAPWAVVDMKAALMWYRLNAALLPGDASRLFVMGLGAGGTLASVVGASGDASDFTPYLEEIGAPQWDTSAAVLSNSVRGVIAWNPLLSFGSVDASYEWLYGQYSDDASRAQTAWTGALSHYLCATFANYVNELGLTHEGEALSLDETLGEALFADGTYNSRLVKILQDAAAEFLGHAQFPLTLTNEVQVNGGFPGGIAVSQDVETSVLTGLIERATQVNGAGSSQVLALEGSPLTVTYQSVKDYVAALNTPSAWFVYNEAKATARITSLGAWARACAPATRLCTGFDLVTKNSSDNQLFGVEDATTVHFSKQISSAISDHMDELSQLEGWEGAYNAQWVYDLKLKNALGENVEQRVNLYDPLYYLSGANAGFSTATPAREWRLNAGLAQSIVPVDQIMNLELAARAYTGVTHVDATYVWEQGMVLAEASGDAIANALTWISQVAGA